MQIRKGSDFDFSLEFPDPVEIFENVLIDIFKNNDFKNIAKLSLYAEEGYEADLTSDNNFIFVNLSKDKTADADVSFYSCRIELQIGEKKIVQSLEKICEIIEDTGL